MTIAAVLLIIFALLAFLRMSGMFLWVFSWRESSGIGLLSTVHLLEIAERYPLCVGHRIILRTLSESTCLRAVQGYTEGKGPRFQALIFQTTSFVTRDNGQPTGAFARGDNYRKEPAGRALPKC